jgi:hypothetical protein
MYHLGTEYKNKRKLYVIHQNGFLNKFKKK